MAKPKRVIVWGSGHFGHEGLKEVIDRPDLELVGVHAWSKDKIGRDAGDLGHTGKTGVLATNDVAALLALNADCLVYFAHTVDREAEITAEIVPFLERGTNVVSITHYELQYPKYGAPALVKPVEDACRRGNSSVLITGTEPGFAFGQHLFCLLSVAGRVDRIDIIEASNVQFLKSPDSLRMYGFTQPLDFRPPMFTSQVGASWHINTQLGIADYCGVKVDEVQQTWETGGMDAPFETATFGMVNPGQTAGTRWTVSVIVGGAPFLVYQKILRLHGDVAPDWPLPGLGRAGGLHQIVITGDPSYENVMRRSGGRSFTPLHAVNAIPFVCDAPAGVVLQHDLPAFKPMNLRK
jgi:2,4-diaminopentanoate dehydrogenase